MEGKTALITGAASGIGLCIATELLKNGLENIVIADFNEKFGQESARMLQENFKTRKVIFVKTDVTKREELEAAFEKAVKEFKTVDILVNNAGIMNEINYQLGIAVNLTGVVHGIMLGFQYMKHNENGGIIFNMSSVAGLDFYSICPMYSATKLGVVGLIRSYGQPLHFKRTGVKVLGLCPALTDTDFGNKILHGIQQDYLEHYQYGKSLLPSQTPESVAKGVVYAMKDGENGSIWCVEESKLFKLEIPDRRTFCEQIIKNI